MSKKYKAIFFDWDGTAVMSRQAPVEEAVAAMKPLLASGVKLVMVQHMTKLPVEKFMNISLQRKLQTFI